MSGWKTAALSEVCSLIARGVAPKYVDEGGALVLNQKCVRDHGLNYSLGRRHDETAKRVSADRFIQVGDVLINSTGTGTLGRVAQVRLPPEEPATVDTHVTIVRPKPGEFDLNFFGYALIVLEDQLAASGEGASGQTELARSVIAKFEISYPTDLSEQRRIVAVLDEAFAAIATATANAEKNLANVRELFITERERILRSPVAGWSQRTLSEICTIKHGFAFKSEHFRDQAENTLLTPGNFFEAGGYRDRGAKQKYYDGPIPDGFVLSGGDLLVAMTEQAAGLLGSPILVPSSGVYLHNQRLGLVQPRTGVEWVNDFFFHVFNTSHLRDQLYQTGTGQKVRHTSPGKIGDVVVHFPATAAEQSAVASQLDDLWSQTEQLSDAYSKRLEKLTHLKQSFLHHAFAGELATSASEAANDNWKTPAFTAQVIALAYRHHLALGTEATFGRVKAQKALHLCESIGGVDLGRNPVKDAAGPNDFQHMLVAEKWARANQFFEFVQKPTGNGYNFRKLPRFSAMVAEGAEALKSVQARLEKAIGLIAPMNSEQAELLATVHAAWNNLILDNVEATEAAIIHEARENWHVAKHKFGDGKFRQAIAVIRAQGIEPDGSAKRVGGQEALLL